MIDKIKAWGEAAKGFILYILTPIAFTLGYIAYLLSKNEKLTRDLEESKFTDQNSTTKSKEGEADEEAKRAIDHYHDVSRKYTGGDEP